MNYSVAFTDLIAIQFENTEDEDFSENALIVFYSPEYDIALMLVDTDPFRAAQIVKKEGARFNLHNGQVYAELDFFRNLMKDTPGAIEGINQLEARVRESIQQGCNHGA